MTLKFSNKVFYRNGSFNIQCDRCCMTEAWHYANRKETIKLAKQEGWKLTNSKVICPDCQRTETQP